MLSVKDAETIIFNHVQPLNQEHDLEIVDLLTGFHRILATPVISALDFPHWDNSAMDGFAVRYEDVQSSTPENPTILEVVQEIPAGYQPKNTIKQGQAARIFTGVIIPKGADTVVMQEKTKLQENRVSIFSAPQPQEFIRKQGDFYQAGTELLPGGITLKAAEIAILAAAQLPKISVLRRPRVAIFSSGDELVTPEQTLKPGQIVDSNQYALAALVRELNAEVLMLGIVKDNPTALIETINYAINHADIVLSSGGVSVGDYDYIDKILASLGAEIHFRAVQMRPGKPLTFATFTNSLYFGLPGNPVSALVTFWRFVQPTIKKLSGINRGWESKFIKVKSHCELKSNGEMETYIWGNLKLNNGIYEFEQTSSNLNSGNLINLAQTNALAILPVGKTLISPGEETLVLQIE
ncbi:molybdopterin molybdotransferase MoeA [Dolichospermum sp. LEGE 00240]|jgi:molybdopterin molybdotransferase|uniref:molybdopterin molybdotransferase MoeA n=1 Tax=Dolichospermum sp. LEGE 00240 TaxID=1828603 RepID=UPI001880E861|nr:gephyrin-like molybdotransferase Glp [Dolichospermum sp. LEGE 00240]MBE9250300.1 molybdopterin molybdotransferase MoeA [Dolichospermum sp. LEGE 00240]MDM3847227.1 molybdopterin molybdotransferase MoeA [Aphanizomenon gracile PMC638.10]MDM3851753.1 molybdopterin molybdotransferase MoeA [Aphanizomenon gracile PMC627.10]MDM3860315.1 molybdopterin molybdotransferase MoeA [Aphanizomenon gracile PMC644.10]